MADHPGMVNIPELWQEPDRLWIQRHFASMMGFGVTYPIRTLLGIASVGTNRYRAGYRASDILSALRARVPVVEGPLALEEHLFLIRENMLHRQRGVVRGSVRFMTGAMVSTFLSPREGRASMFERLGFTEPDGSPIKVTSHQFRHWLNTLAQEGGLSQELIARWSGRKDMSQNAAYDHVSGRKLAEQVRQLADAGALAGPMAKVRDALPPVDRRGFIETAIASAHVTEIGLCVHDWSLAPCPNHGDCSNCGEHVIDKGNEKHVAEAERQLEEVERMLALTDPAVEEGTYGAARWQEAHRRRRDGLRAALAVHRDQTISDGTLVHQSRR